MTLRLYRDDPSLLRFSARIREARIVGERRAVLLDQSAFYPEGGGQPGDQGTLGDLRVLDTQEQESEVLHFIDPAAPLPAPGTEVAGVVDGARRQDHLQQHHGQHLLSAAFLRVLQFPTVSFHLGEKVCTIDLDGSVSRLDAAALRSVEAAANATVWADLPVVHKSFTPEERALLPMRKEAVKGDRVVVVEGVDASPCGGTHPRRTGEVGAIAVLRALKWGQEKARVEFVCGARVVRLLAEQGGQLAAAVQALGCGPTEVAEAAARVRANERAQFKANETLSEELCGFLAWQLHDAQPGGPVVAELQRPHPFARGVASALAGLGRVALVAAVEGGRAQLCFARPKGEGPAMGDLVRAALLLLGGKGGGGADFGQGSGEAARVSEALAQARATIF